MEAYQWLSLIAVSGVGFTGLALLLGKRLTALEIGVGKRLTALEKSIQGVRSDLTGLRSSIRAQTEILSVIVGTLHSRKLLSDEERSRVAAAFGRIADGEVEKAIRKAEEFGNPITHEEAERLRGYVRMAREGLSFTSEQAQDFYDLSDKVSREAPDEPGVWPLAALAAFLLGLYMGAKK